MVLDGFEQFELVLDRDFPHLCVAGQADRERLSLDILTNQNAFN